MATNTTPAQISDAPAALGAVVRQPPAPRMPAASLGIRVKTSPAMRRLVPSQLVVKRAVRQGQALWERGAGERERAMSVMQTILAGTSRAHEVEELARLHLIEDRVDSALFWQPWSASMKSDSAALLDEALAGNRGILLSACHMGPYYRSLYALPHESPQPYTVAGPWFFDQPSNDFWGRRLARWRKGALGRPVHSKGSFPVLRDLLSRGETVYLFFDLPGRRETRFLGKPAMLADGSARLAIEADAPIVPMRAERVGHRVRVEVETPLDPREISDVEALHNAVAAVHERWILDDPAAMADPNSFGWDRGASAQAWIRP
jgi:hypothetical protein